LPVDVARHLAAYIDDLAHASTKASRQETVRAEIEAVECILVAAEAAGITFRLKKCEFCKSKILGAIIRGPKKWHDGNR